MKQTILLLVMAVSLLTGLAQNKNQYHISVRSVTGSYPLLWEIIFTNDNWKTYDWVYIFEGSIQMRYSDYNCKKAQADAKKFATYESCLKNNEQCQKLSDQAQRKDSLLSAKAVRKCADIIQIY